MLPQQQQNQAAALMQQAAALQSMYPMPPPPNHPLLGVALPQQGSDGLNSVGDQVETEYSSALTLKEVITALG